MREAAEEVIEDLEAAPPPDPELEDEFELCPLLLICSCFDD